MRPTRPRTDRPGRKTGWPHARIVRIPACFPSRAVPDREYAPPLVGTTAHARSLDVVIAHDARTAAGEVDHQCQDAKQGEAAIGMPEGLALLARRQADACALGQHTPDGRVVHRRPCQRSGCSRSRNSDSHVTWHRPEQVDRVALPGTPGDSSWVGTSRAGPAACRRRPGGRWRAFQIAPSRRSGRLRGLDTAVPRDVAKPPLGDLSRSASVIGSPYADPAGSTDGRPIPERHQDTEPLVRLGVLAKAGRVVTPCSTATAGRTLNRRSGAPHWGRHRPRSVRRSRRSRSRGCGAQACCRRRRRSPQPAWRSPTRRP